MTEISEAEDDPLKLEEPCPFCGGILSFCYMSSSSRMHVNEWECERCLSRKRVERPGGITYRRSGHPLSEGSAPAKREPIVITAEDVRAALGDPPPEDPNWQVRSFSSLGEERTWNEAVRHVETQQTLEALKNRISIRLAEIDNAAFGEPRRVHDVMSEMIEAMIDEIVDDLPKLVDGARSER